MIIEIDNVGAFDHSQVSVTTTPTKLAASKFSLRRGVLLKALAANNAAIYVGGCNVTTANGFPLDAKESIFIPIDACEKVFVVAGTTQSVAVVWY